MSSWLPSFMQSGDPRAITVLGWAEAEVRRATTGTVITTWGQTAYGKSLLAYPQSEAEAYARASGLIAVASQLVTVNAAKQALTAAALSNLALARTGYGNPDYAQRKVQVPAVYQKAAQVIRANASQNTQALWMADALFKLVGGASPAATVPVHQYPNKPTIEQAPDLDNVIPFPQATAAPEPGAGSGRPAWVAPAVFAGGTILALLLLRAVLSRRGR